MDGIESMIIAALIPHLLTEISKKYFTQKSHNQLILAQLVSPMTGLAVHIVSPRLSESLVAKRSETGFWLVVS